MRPYLWTVTALNRLKILTVHLQNASCQGKEFSSHRERSSFLLLPLGYFFRPSGRPVRGSGDASTSAPPGAGSCSSSARRRPCSPPLCRSVLHHSQRRRPRGCPSWCCGRRWRRCPATAGAWRGFQFGGAGRASGPPPWRGPGRSPRWWWSRSSSESGFSLLQGSEKELLVPFSLNSPHLLQHTANLRLFAVSVMWWYIHKSSCSCSELVQSSRLRLVSSTERCSSHSAFLMRVATAFSAPLCGQKPRSKQGRERVGAAKSWSCANDLTLSWDFRSWHGCQLPRILIFYFNYYF